jgi:hypothetical protein
MSDLVEFLRARLDEDEDIARRAAFGWGSTWTTENDVLNEWSAHLARNDPARVLADIAAKRAIVGHVEAMDHGGARAHEQFRQWEVSGEEILCHLAAVYADHPDYDPAWRTP